jgi:pentatricopeptide repeat protein
MDYQSYTWALYQPNEAGKIERTSFHIYNMLINVACCACQIRYAKSIFNTIILNTGNSFFTNFFFLCKF